MKLRFGIMIHVFSLCCNILHVYMRINYCHWILKALPHKTTVLKIPGVFEIIFTRNMAGSSNRLRHKQGIQDNPCLRYRYFTVLTINNYCKQTLICVRKNFERFARAFLSQTKFCMLSHIIG
jgi:hypothetical protein